MARPVNPAVRQRILSEAEHLIHLHGFHATAMDDIARCCGMTKANLFHHYGSKEELVLAVLDAKMADYRTRRVDPPCDCREPIEGIAKMFRDAKAFHTGNGCKAGCFVGNIALEMADLSEVFRERASAFFREWSERLARCLARARAEGYFAPTLEPRAAADSIISLYEGAVMLARTRRDATVFDRVGRMARAMLEQHRKGGQ